MLCLKVVHNILNIMKLNDYRSYSSSSFAFLSWARAAFIYLCLLCALQEIRNMHNEQLMGIRREEEMEMSDDDMEDIPDSKDSEDSGMHMHARIHSSTRLSSSTGHARVEISRGWTHWLLNTCGRRLCLNKMNWSSPRQTSDSHLTTLHEWKNMFKFLPKCWQRSRFVELLLNLIAECLLAQFATVKRCIGVWLCAQLPTPTSCHFWTQFNISAIIVCCSLEGVPFCLLKQQRLMMLLISYPLQQ